MDVKGIAVIGLGYVGLPLAVEFAKHFHVYGFDIDTERIKELNESVDRTLEVGKEDLKNTSCHFTDNFNFTNNVNVFIVTVPTPIKQSKIPDLEPLKKATLLIGKSLKKDDIIIYESTVFPGCTEEVCVPILEKTSGLHYNQDFFVGYSPERMNPGDREHNLKSIIKLTSGSTPKIAHHISEMYKQVVQSGIYQTSSIKVAEAAKVIENTQRDLNVAFVNELAILFSKMNLDTTEVLEAAGTKWNFLNFKPGLVGGHCIGVDPYYLTFKAQELGHNPEVILAGRRINDHIPKFIVSELIKLLIKSNKKVRQSKVLILGATFKENCPDLRNSKVKDMIDELIDYQCHVEVFDPWINKTSYPENYPANFISIESKEQLSRYDAIILAVGHSQFEDYKSIIGKLEDTLIYDVKGFFSKSEVDGRL